MRKKQTSSEKFRLGLIVNPISGMGGAVGLKGTDGTEILKKAKELGAEPRAMNRTEEFLEKLSAVKSRIEIITPPGIMGADVVQKADFETIVLDANFSDKKFELYDTTPKDTEDAARLMLDEDIKLLVFVGGDGTARNILNAVGQEQACLGLPAGVKIHSSVFSINPTKAAELVMRFLWGEAPLRESEVMDIDEEKFRKNEVDSQLYGYLMTPYDPLYIQASKMAMPSQVDEEDNKEAIARWIIEEMEDNIYYLIGPGTTTRPIATLLDQEKTLLGVDLMLNEEIITKDLNESEILKKISGEKARIIVTPIGNQGFIFGRGNLQFSSRVIRAVGIDNIIIICTKYKKETLPDGKLRIDTRDADLDSKMKGLYKVLVDYGEYRIIELI